MKRALLVQAVPFGRPANMDRTPMSEEMRKGLSEVSMSIFLDCSNAGVSFQESILAVYLSGLHHGGAIKEAESV